MRIMIEMECDGKLNLNELNINGKSIKRIWTVYDEKRMWDSTNFNPITGEKLINKTLDDLILKHHEGVFLEDAVHDWNVRAGNILHYYTRVLAKGDKTKLILEIE